jgi:exonuclease III
MFYCFNFDLRWITHYVSLTLDNKNSYEQYIDTLAQLEEIIDKYQSDGYQIIICGDMNASQNRDDRSRDKIFVVKS